MAAICGRKTADSQIGALGVARRSGVQAFRNVGGGGGCLSATTNTASIMFKNHSWDVERSAYLDCGDAYRHAGDDEGIFLDGSHQLIEAAVNVLH